MLDYKLPIVAISVFNAMSPQPYLMHHVPIRPTWQGCQLLQLFLYIIIVPKATIYMDWHLSFINILKDQGLVDKQYIFLNIANNLDNFKTW